MKTKIHRIWKIIRYGEELEVGFILSDVLRYSVPAECATPPRPPRYRTPGPGRGPHPPSWRRLPARFAHPSPAAPAPTPRTRSRTAPILPRHRSAPGPPRDTPDEKDSVQLDLLNTDFSCEISDGGGGVSFGGRIKATWGKKDEK